MKLKALKSFSGLHGNAAQGSVFEVPDKVAELMVKDRYPVEKVVEHEAKRAASRRRAKSPARS